MKPMIYDCAAYSELDFLNDYEKSYLRVEDKDLQEMLLKRGKMFLLMHRAWSEFDSKKDRFKQKYIQVCTFKQQIPKKEVETGFKYKPQ